jgi:hypothetical protein
MIQIGCPLTQMSTITGNRWQDLSTLSRGHTDLIHSYVSFPFGVRRCITRQLQNLCPISVPRAVFYKHRHAAGSLCNNQMTRPRRTPTHSQSRDSTGKTNTRKLRQHHLKPSTCRDGRCLTGKSLAWTPPARLIHHWRTGATSVPPCLLLPASPFI